MSPSPSMEDTAQTCSLTLGFSQHRSDWRGRHSFSLWYMLRVKAQRRTAVMNGGNSADIFPTDFARWVLSSFWGTSMPDLVEGWQAELAPFTSKNGEICTDILKQMDGWIPSTFEECHQGPSWTWTHPRGNKSRLDYIIVENNNMIR